MLGKAGHARGSLGRGVGIVLVVVLQGDEVFGGGIPVEIADGLVCQEVRCAELKGVGGRKRVGNVAIVVGDEPLSVGKFSLEEGEADRIGGPVGGADGEAVLGVLATPVSVDYLGQAC